MMGDVLNKSELVEKLAKKVEENVNDRDRDGKKKVIYELAESVKEGIGVMIGLFGENTMSLVLKGRCGGVIVRGSEVIWRSDTTTGTQNLEWSFQDGDLCVFGGGGLWNNLSERQLLAFTRPVPEGRQDRTLSIANATCLATWTSDDVDYISYYLAHIAHNFATAESPPPGLKRSQFVLDEGGSDITVIAASCSFALQDE